MRSRGEPLLTTLKVVPAFFSKTLKLITLLTGYAKHFIQHLCFMQAQPKMCHSPKVDDGVDI